MGKLCEMLLAVLGKIIHIDIMLLSIHSKEDDCRIWHILQLQKENQTIKQKLTFQLAEGWVLATDHAFLLGKIISHTPPHRTSKLHP